MHIKFLFSIVFMLLSLLSLAQDNFYSTINLDENLTKKANAIIRLSEMEVSILDINKINVKHKRIVTVLNSRGNSKIGAILYYDLNHKINTLEAKIYNAFGKEIKKFKKKEFIDASAADGFSLYRDDRVKYLDYTPVNYPYTVEFTEEYETSFTVAIPGWNPLEGYNVSVQRSTYKIINESNIDTSIKINNLDEFNIENDSNLSFEANNIQAIKSESYSPAFAKFAPSVKIALKEFNIEGVRGINNTWKDFGKWMNEKLLMNTQDLPQKSKDEIIALTKNTSSNLEKARIVYKYVQDKTRYISIQVGIGGWKPMLASDVDKLGYGDCKGLSNYTKALMDEVGVEAYYTVIYGDNTIKNIEDSFSSLQGNHVILCIPNGSDYVWLECTSQTSPFGYIANFTDDRDALIITPEGGKIQHTKVYETHENSLVSKSKVNLDELGGFSAVISSKSRGTQYHYHEDLIRKTQNEKELHFKDYWNYINNLKIEEIEFENNKDSIIFKEKIRLSATKYASKTGNLFLLKPNFFNRIEQAPKRYTMRKLPFEVERGFVDIDEYEISLPDNLEIEGIMNPISVETKFGTYEASVKKIDDKSLVYKRKFILNKGNYNKEEYIDFRDFWLKIIKYDNSKMVLKTKV